MARAAWQQDARSVVPGQEAAGMVRKHNYGAQQLRSASAWDNALDQLQGSGGPHPPFSGTHNHSHSSYGHLSGDDDGQHSHSHAHHGDSDHGEHDDAHELLPPQASGGRYARHIRFEHGQALELAGQGRIYCAAAALYDRAAPAAPLDGKFASLGEFVKACRDDVPRVARLQNAFSERIPAEGGFAVGEEFRSDLMLYTLEQSIVRPRATVIPSTSLRVNVPVVEEGSHSGGTVLGGMEFEWSEEGSALVSSVASYGRITLEAKKLAGYMTVPNELFEDADHLDAFLREAIPAGMAFAEDQAFIAGSGAGQPQGILNAPCQIQVTRQTSSEVTFTDLIKMQERMLPASMTSFIWLVSPDVLIWLLEIFLNFGSATSGIAPPPDWLRFSDELGLWVLMGRPCFPTEHVQALGTLGDVIAVDPRFVVIADRQLLQIDVAPEPGTGFLQDLSAVRVTSRVDARVWLASPVTPQNASETVSPVVILK
jgi:hypothetical protein